MGKLTHSHLRALLRRIWKVLSHNVPSQCREWFTAIVSSSDGAFPCIDRIPNTAFFHHNTVHFIKMICTVICTTEYTLYNDPLITQSYFTTASSSLFSPSPSILASPPLVPCYNGSTLAFPPCFPDPNSHVLRPASSFPCPASLRNHWRCLVSLWFVNDEDDGDKRRVLCCQGDGENEALRFGICVRPWRVILVLVLTGRFWRFPGCNRWFANRTWTGLAKAVLQHKMEK